MEKIDFKIKEIRVAKSGIDSYDLNIFLKSGIQLNSQFFDEKLYCSAMQAKDNLTDLKNLFFKNIDDILKQNPHFSYFPSDCELFDINFGHITEDPEDDIYEESMDLLRSCADEKGIEFDGYLKQRWEESADTIINFDEDYFDDPDRIELYVYLSALVDGEIFGFLNHVYFFFEHKDITKEIIKDKVTYLIQMKGVKF